MPTSIITSDFTSLAISNCAQNGSNQHTNNLATVKSKITTNDTQQWCTISPGSTIGGLLVSGTASLSKVEVRCINISSGKFAYGRRTG